MTPDSFLYRICIFKEIFLTIFACYNTVHFNRIEMTLSCAMALQNYPLDRQSCPVTIESCK